MTTTEGPDRSRPVVMIGGVTEHPSDVADDTEPSVYDEWRHAFGLPTVDVVKHGGPGAHATTGTPQTVHSSRGPNAAKTRAAARSDAKTGKRTSGFSRAERRANNERVKGRRSDTERAERETAAGELVTGRRAPQAAKPKPAAPKPAAVGGKKISRDQLADMAQQARRQQRTIDMASRRKGDPKADTARKKAESAVRDLEARAKKSLPADVTRRGTLIDWVAEMDRRRAIDLGASGSS